MQSAQTKIQKILFYLTILFLPTQLGKHFWPDFAFISGLRIDYLSPTIYLTDILMILLFVSVLFNWLMRKPTGLMLNVKCQMSNIKSKPKKQFKISNYFKLVLLVLFLLVGIVFSKNPQSGIYGLIKLSEFVFFGFYTANFIKNKKDLSRVIFLFSFPIIFESILAIFQFLNQGSLNGIFYFFGERMFNSQTPGIANASINGVLIVRPYATFPHPNVLAGYLLIGMILIISNIKYQKSKLKKRIFFLTIFLGTVALFLTLSRIAIFVWLLILVFAALNRLREKRVWMFYSLLIILLLLGIFLSPLHSRFTKINFFDESILIREDLISKSILMIKNHPIFGVGLNNFLINQINYQKVGEYPIVNFLQPVHNIYLLIASEIGIVGLIYFLWFVFKTFSKISKQNKKSLIFSLILFLGLFDHYFLTLQQGQLLFSFILGLCWVTLKR